jgi:hypothetical protein
MGQPMCATKKNSLRPVSIAGKQRCFHIMIGTSPIRLSNSVVKSIAETVAGMSVAHLLFQMTNEPVKRIFKNKEG